MSRIFLSIKPTIVLVAGLGAIYVCGRDVRIALRESHPQDYTIQKLVSKHAGEQWLTVTGRLRPELMNVRFGKPSSVAPNKAYYVWVPMLAIEERADAPIHVLVSYMFPTQFEMEKWKSHCGQQGTHSVSGILAPLGSPRYEEMFPDSTFQKPLFFLNAGAKPIDPRGGYFLLALGIIMVLVSGRWFYLAFRSHAESSLQRTSSPH